MCLVNNKWKLCAKRHMLLQRKRNKPRRPNSLAHRAVACNAPRGRPAQLSASSCFRSHISKRKARSPIIFYCFFKKRTTLPDTTVYIPHISTKKIRTSLSICASLCGPVLFFLERLLKERCESLKKSSRQPGPVDLGG